MEQKLPHNVYFKCTFYGPTGPTQPVQTSSVILLLNELGKDGWEVFQFLPTQNGGTYWLKRPASR